MPTIKIVVLQIILKRHFRGKNKSIFDYSSAPPQIINGQHLSIEAKCGTPVYLWVTATKYILWSAFLLHRVAGPKLGSLWHRNQVLCFF